MFAQDSAVCGHSGVSFMTYSVKSDLCCAHRVASAYYTYSEQPNNILQTTLHMHVCAAHGEMHTHIRTN